FYHGGRRGRGGSIPAFDRARRARNVFESGTPTGFFLRVLRVLRGEKIAAIAASLLLSTTSLRGAGSESPLADAAEKMDRDAIHTLLQQHADVNAAQVDGMTALHWATYQDD